MPPEKNIPGIYEGGRPYIASFARTVFQARKEGDAAAEEIFQKAVHALASLHLRRRGSLEAPTREFWAAEFLPHFRNMQRS